MQTSAGLCSSRARWPTGPFVDTVGYSIQTCWLLQFLLKPLLFLRHFHNKVHMLLVGNNLAWSEILCQEQPPYEFLVRQNESCRKISWLSCSVINTLNLSSGRVKYSIWVVFFHTTAHSAIFSHACSFINYGSHTLLIIFMLTDGSCGLLISLQVLHFSLNSLTGLSQKRTQSSLVWNYREHCMNLHGEWALPFSIFQTWISLFNSIQMWLIVPL